MKKLTLSLAAVSLAVLVTSAYADPVPYNNPNHVAPTPSLPITATGNVLDLYFYGHNAGDTDYIVVEDLTTHTNSGMIFDNQTTTPGYEVTFSTNPGDVLEFELVNTSTHTDYYSTPSDNPDHENHVYITPFTSGDSIDGIPAGTFVGFEDEYIVPNSDGVCDGRNNQSDCDYNDDEFVYVNTNSAATPEPSSLALLGTSILGAAGMLRRRFTRQ